MTSRSAPPAPDDEPSVIPARRLLMLPLLLALGAAILATPPADAAAPRDVHGAKTYTVTRTYRR